MDGAWLAVIVVVAVAAAGMLFRRREEELPPPQDEERRLPNSPPMTPYGKARAPLLVTDLRRDEGLHHPVTLTSIATTITSRDQQLAEAAEAGRQAARRDLATLAHSPETRAPTPSPGAPPHPSRLPAAPATMDVYDFRKPLQLHVSYQDAKGDRTARLVDITSYSVPISTPDGRPTRFRGHCHLRQSSRAFIISRVEEAFEMIDGTLVPDVALWLLEQPSRRRPRDLGL